MSDAAASPSRTQAPVPGGRILAFGHSHLTPLQHAYAEYGLASAPGIPSITFVQMLEAEYRTATQELDYGKVAARLAAEASQGDVAAAFTCFSGNDYHVLSMVRHPRPFDFVMPRYEALPLQQGAQIVPFPTVLHSMQSAVATAIDELRLLRSGMDCPFYVIASPPPIFDNAYLGQPGNAFWSKAESLGISPPEFRFKFWRLQSDIYAAAARSMDAVYLEPPQATVDRDGFMVERGWHQDGVHGNSWYGRQVLEQVFEALRGSVAHPVGSTAATAPAQGA